VGRPVATSAGGWRLAPSIGLLGVLAVAGGALVTGLAYRGPGGGAYSPLNQFVSELGEAGVSGLAIVFNLGLILGGICFVVFLVSLGRRRRGVAGSLQAATGAIAGIAGSIVGIAPVNSGGPHVLAAGIFFNVAWITIALASTGLGVHPDRRVTAVLAGIGVVTVITSIAFILVYATSGSAGSGGSGPAGARPDLDPVTVLEWASFGGILAWTAAVAGVWRRGRRAVVA